MIDATPLVLLPGLLCDAESWQPWCNSEPEALVPEYAAAGELAELAAYVLANAPDEFDLAGHSMGGYVALEVCRQAAGRVRRLALISTQAVGDTPEQAALRENLVADAESDGLDGIAQMLAKFNIPRSVEGAEEMRNRFVAMAGRYGVDRFAAHQRATARRPSQVDLLPTLDMPCLVMGAQDDKIVPFARSEEMAAALPHATLTAFASGGHLPLWTQPNECADALSGWRKTGEPARIS